MFTKTKKNLLVGCVTGVLSLLAVNSAFAVGSAGCGLGSIIFKENVWWKQVLAATTNGSSGTQTFGITTGTSNCSSSGSISRNQEQKNYVVVNFSSLQREAAQGNGATIDGLASVSGCPANSYSEFASFVQANYSEIFSTNSPDAIVDTMNLKIGSNNNLTKICQVGSI